MGHTLEYTPGCEDQSPISIFTEATFSTAAPLWPRNVPVMIPADEVAYWNLVWRQGDAESRAAHEAGEYVTFDSDDPNDAARWLLSDD
jgi:hypothetical protein